jgi:MFS family permease
MFISCRVTHKFSNPALLDATVNANLLDSYVADLVPAGQRGAWGVMTQIMINIGILLTQTLGFFYSKNWRIILGIGAAIGLSNLLGLMFLSEKRQDDDIETSRLLRPQVSWITTYLCF